MASGWRLSPAPWGTTSRTARHSDAFLPLRTIGRRRARSDHETQQPAPRLATTTPVHSSVRAMLARALLFSLLVVTPALADDIVWRGHCEFPGEGRHPTKLVYDTARECNDALLGVAEL